MNSEITTAENAIRPLNTSPVDLLVLVYEVVQLGTVWFFGDGAHFPLLVDGLFRGKTLDDSD